MRESFSVSLDKLPTPADELVKLETEFGRLYFLCLKLKNGATTFPTERVVPFLNSMIDKWRSPQPWSDYLKQEIREIETKDKDPRYEGFRLRSSLIRLFEEWEVKMNVAHELCKTEHREMKYLPLDEREERLLKIGNLNINIKDALARDGFGYLFVK